MQRTASIVLITSLLVLSACERSGPEQTVVAAKPTLQTEIRWTAFGIPHVKADNWAGLGYGFAYATARDGVCVLARELVRVDGEMTRYFADGENNLPSDIFHKALLTPQRLTEYASGESSKSNAFAGGYVAGYNRYLRDHQGSLPADCNGASWLRPMVAADVAGLALSVSTRYGLGRMVAEIAAAKPPRSSSEEGVNLQTDFDVTQGDGSNAVALGRAVTASGRGILFGNPHYPWEGPARFHMLHATIPGELDVMGVSLLVTPRVVIGFNKDVAWSHTVSTALRSTFYELELNPDNAMQYRYGEGFRDIEAVVVKVNETNAHGDIMSGQHTLYFSHFGPLVVSKALPWTSSKAYALRDSNLENTHTSATYDALNKARTVAEIEAAISLQGVSWTNTIAADRAGDAFYADISVTPNVDTQLLERCRVYPEQVPTQAVVLRGNDADCEWREDERSAIPGVMPAQDMPRLYREDYVANSNDSYWLSNPQQPLQGYSPIIGAERTARSLRTRAGLTFINELLAQGEKITPDDMQAMFYTQRNFGAELLLDDVLSLCTAELEPVTWQEQSIDVGESCTVLRDWDRLMTISSRGGHVWREFWRIARKIDGVYAVPFDASQPMTTPSGLAVGNSQVRAALLEALAQAQVTLEDANIALDAPLGEIQYKTINGRNIPIPGGEGWAGMWSMIIAELQMDAGYTPIQHGNSYVQVISWDEQGKLDPRAILTYSQSPEPDAAHSSDMTELYAKGGWVDLPFSEAEIAADPRLETLLLKE